MWRPRQGIGTLRVWLLGLSLAVALALTSVLAYQAVLLDRSHRAVAEAVLRDYSAFAADQFARVADDQLRSLTGTILQPVACRATSKERLAAAVEHGGIAASCSNPTAVDGFFEAEPDTGRIVFVTGSIESSTREALARTRIDGSFGFDVLPGQDGPTVVGYLSDVVPGGQKRVIGFIAASSFVASVFDRIMHEERLLPGALTEPAQNRDYLAVDIRANDTSIYRSGQAASAGFISDRPLGPHAGSVRVRMGINEAAAARLIIGGVPRSRLPLLLSLLVLTVGLLTIGTWQIHREHRLAAMRVDFVRSASHELRTPLAQIRLFTETLQLGRVRSWTEVVQSLAFVDQQSRRLSRLVENLLTFAHGGQQRRANMESIELGAFLSDASRGFRPIAESLGQQLRLDQSEPCVVRGDREWLTQVILNLLDNATKYGPTGQTITLRIERDSQHGRIIVDDQGPGIPSNERERVFAPFVRLPREHERRTGGTGIGLAVAADLTAAMDGRIWAGAAPNGARFIVALPAVEASEARPLVA